MAYHSSLDKTALVYFASVTKEPFAYGSKTIEPKPLRVYPSVFRHYTCPPMCGACCMKFTLVLLPGERRAEAGSWQTLYVPVNGKTRLFIEDPQNDNPGHYCKHLRHEDGRCGIHESSPMTCDFELARFLRYKTYTAFTQKLFGRGWSYTSPVTGDKGALCEIIPQTSEQRDDLVRRLLRLKEWTDYCELNTWLPEVIEWCRTGPHATTLVLDPASGVVQQDDDEVPMLIIP